MPPATRSLIVRPTMVGIARIGFRAVTTALVPVLIASALTGPGCAAGQAPASPAEAIKAHDWPQAQAAVADGDPLAATLVIYLRLLSPDAPPGDIADFLVAHPDWPDRAALRGHYDAALKKDGDDGAVAAACHALPPRSAAALVRCAAAADGTDEAAGWAREAWRDGIGAGAHDDAIDADFLRRWDHALTGEDDWQRFERLTFPRGNAREAAARVAVRLDGTRRAVADARLAMPDQADPMAAFAAVPPDRQGDPALVLSVARQLRRDGANAAAVAFWRARAMSVETRQPAAMQAWFWSERDLLTRALLASPGQDADAFALADDGGNAAPTARADALFLAGWVALRRLDQPLVAAARFTSLGTVSASVTTRARAAYWLARAEAATGAAAASLRHDAEAASFPTTFYGQRALASLSPGGAALSRLRTALAAARAPDWTSAQAVAFASADMPRAAILLVAWGEAVHAKPFLGAADVQATTVVGHALAAQLAVTLGLPDEAVAIARRAGREGRALPPVGWPRPVMPPPELPAALVLGLIRQESGFDANAVSPSGALGLMQLLPATASDVGRRVHLAAMPARLTADPSLNMQLGTAYLRQLLDRFGGNVPVAIAAYNAGPRRVSGWSAPPPASSAGNAAAFDEPDAATVDWIESIPVSETRNYVQRVLENQAIYAAMAGAQGSG